jgi:hypothetical protein
VHDRAPAAAEWVREQAPAAARKVGDKLADTGVVDHAR